MVGNSPQNIVALFNEKVASTPSNQNYKKARRDNNNLFLLHLM